MSDLFNKTAYELSQLLEQRKTSSTEITESFLNRISKVEPEIRAFVTMDEESALESARSADQSLEKGDSGPLTGIPIAIKDNMCFRGRRTSCGSRILENFKPPYNATVVDKIQNAGLVILGSANMDEFAMGSSTETSCWGATRNPWGSDLTPGGSSGGSAASVAACETPLSLGSDTGGSIRLPASFCGITGLKPTYGAVSRFGLVAYASSLDQIGPFAHDIKDVALLLNLISGHDPMDSTSAPVKHPDFTKCLKTPIKGMTIGAPSQFFEKIENQDDFHIPTHVAMLDLS